MDDVINALLDKGAAASDVSDKIKDMLFAKSAAKVDDLKNDVASKLFNDQDETEASVESEPQEEEEPRNED